MMRPFPLWLRAMFLINVLLLSPQVIGLVSPDNIPFPVQLTSLNARFIGALYLAGAVAMLVSGLGQDLADGRIVLYAFAVISVLVLIVTLVYWTDFSSKGFPIIWLAIYVVDPITAVVALVLLRPLRAARPGLHGLSSLFCIEAAVFGLTGIVLLALPEVATLLWPWKINPLLSQVYGAFLLAFAIAALLAIWESRQTALLPTIAGIAVLAVGAFVASLLHLDRFATGMPTTVWFAVLALTLLAFGPALLWQARPVHVRRERTLAQ